AEAFSQIKTYGEATSSARTPEQTASARFWSANVVRQYNRLAREVAEDRDVGLLQTARLIAMVDTVGADALISCLFAKYHYLFWRPVTAIDPTAVTADGFGPVPGYDDGNTATLEQAGWRPLLATPNHPEYPAAHGAITSAMAEVFSTFLGTQRINLHIHGFDAAGSAGNLNAVSHFEKANDLRNEIIYARLWAGLHYHFSSVAGVLLGRNVAKHDLRHAFRPLNSKNPHSGRGGCPPCRRALACSRKSICQRPRCIVWRPVISPSRTRSTRSPKACTVSISTTSEGRGKGTPYRNESISHETCPTNQG